VVPNLTFGHSYRATFSDPATGATAPPITFTAILNNSTVDSALLYTPPSIGKVTLQFNYTVSGTTTVCKVETPSATCSPSSAVPNPPGPPQVPDLPQVRLTGTVGFTFSGPGQPGAPIQNSFTATANGDGTWSFAPSDISQLLPSASVMFSVTDPVGAFQPFSVTLSPTIPAGVISLQPFTLTPAPVTITNGTCVGSVSPSSGVPVTVTVSPPIQGASVVVGGCPPGVPGNLIWQTTSPAVQAQPGVYTLTFSAPGFDSQTAFYAVPFFPGVAFPNNLTITLVAHVTLIVTPTFTPQPNLAFPTVFLFRTTSGSNVLVGQQTLSSTLLSATFPDLSVQDTFEVDIRGPGFKTSSTTGINLNNGTTISPTLTAEGFITGTLNGRINTTTSPLAGQTVTATSDGTCASAGPLSVTTDADGKFTIVGDPSTADGGLCNTATYTLSASVPGYALATTTVPISSTGANAAPEPPATNAFVAVANKIVQKVTVTDLDGNAIKPPPGSSTGGVALSITDFSPIGSPVTFTQEPDKITYDLTIDPTSYKFFFTATGYTPQTLGPIPYSPNESPPLLTVKLLLDKNTITGTVTTPGPGGTTVPLPGVTVSLFPDTLGAQAFTSVTTNSSGVYTLTSEGGGKNPTYIPDGTYVLGATLAGYTYLQQPQAFQTTLPETIVNLSLVPNQVRVSVAVSSNLGSSSDLTGATVTLTPVTSAGSPPPCGSPLVPGFGTAQSATVASSTATFNQVVPDVYTLTASDPNHPAQTGTRLTVCPGGSMSTSFTFQEGEVTGTVSVPDGFGLLPSNVTLNLFAGGSPSGPPLAFTETCPSSSNSCTFFAFVPLNSVYTAQASMTGLTTQTQTTSSQVTTQNPTANVTLNLLAAPREVDVTVNSGGTSPIPLAAGTVKLSGTTLSATIANGLATLTGVAPSTSPYTITVTDRAITASGSVSVPIGVGTVPITVTAAFGQISGSVVLSPAPKKSTNVMATVCDGATLCATPIETVPLTADTSGNAPYTLQLPPSSANGDVVTFSAGSPYVDQHTNPLTVTDGGQIQVPTITLTAPPPSTTTTT
jgi:hypothetical protein